MSTQMYGYCKPLNISKFDTYRQNLNLRTNIEDKLKT